MSKPNKPYFCSCYKPVSSNIDDVLDPTTVIINDELNRSIHNGNLFNKSDKELYYTESNNNQCGFLSFFNLFLCYKKDTNLLS
jgi:hypothetical protein